MRALEIMNKVLTLNTVGLAKAVRLTRASIGACIPLAGGTPQKENRANGDGGSPFFGECHDLPHQHRIETSNKPSFAAGSIHFSSSPQTPRRGAVQEKHVEIPGAELICLEGAIHLKKDMTAYPEPDLRDSIAFYRCLGGMSRIEENARLAE